MVGAEVDDGQVGRQGGGDGGGLPVRQGEEDQVGLGQRGRLGRRQHPVGQADQVRVDGAESLPRAGVSGDRAHVELGVRGQQAQQLAARVSAGSGDGDGRSHAQEHTA